MKDDGTGAGKPKLRSHHVTLIVNAAFCYFLDGLAHSILGPLVPSIAAELGLSKAQMGTVLTANLAGQIVGLLLVPLLSRRFEHRTLIIGCTVAFGILEIASGFPQQSWQLIALRFLTGIGLGGLLPSVLALVADAVPSARRGTALMTLFVGYGCGQILSGIVGGVFANGHWREALFLGGGLSVAYALLAAPRLPRSIAPAAGSDIAMTGGGNLRSLFANGMLPATLSLWAIFICAFSVNYSLVSWLPTLVIGLGYPAAVASLTVSAFAVGGVAASIVAGPLVDRFGSFRIVGGCFALGAVLLLLDSQIAGSATASLFLVVTAIAGLCVLGGLGGINVVLADLYPRDTRAVGAGWAKGVSRVGAMLPPVAIGIALDQGVPGQLVLALLAIPVALAAMTVLWLATRRSHHAGRPAPRSP